MNISELWTELESESAQAGEFRRRIHPESIADLHLVVRKPMNARALRIDVGPDDTEIDDLPSGRGIDLEWVPTAAGDRVLELVLAQPAFADLFDALVTDIAAAAAVGTNRTEVASLVAGRVRRWQNFLRETSAGLSLERQRGLYGELYFLRRTVLKLIHPDSAVASWVGPLAAPQDFSFGRTAVEVKTTMANQHQALRIASERQLDSTGLDHLAVFHLSVDAREGAGETLPAIISGVRSDLGSEVSRELFEDRLFSGGYLDLHAGQYKVGYTIREANVFEVGRGFPRLVEVDCPSGVGDVSYSIAVSSLSAFAVDAQRVAALVSTGADGA